MMQAPVITAALLVSPVLMACLMLCLLTVLLMLILREGGENRNAPGPAAISVTAPPPPGYWSD